MKNNINRRSFLLAGMGLGLTTLGNPNGTSWLPQAAAAALTQKGWPDYKALVCINLAGGNDGFNTIVPTAAGTGAGSYDNYFKARGGIYDAQSNTGGLAIAQNQLLSLTGQDLGLHPNMTELRSLFNGGQASILANIGPLLQPTNKTDYRTQGFPLPSQLFSHNNQTVLWQLSHANAEQRLGWGGLMADLLGSANDNNNLPLGISLSGNNTFQTGASTQPFFASRRGVEEIGQLKTSNGACDSNAHQREQNKCAAFKALLGMNYDHPFEQTYRNKLNAAIDRGDMVKAAIASTPAWDPFYEPFWSAYGTSRSENNYSQLSNFAQELLMTLRMIHARGTLQMSRQTFYIQLGGFDTHDGQITNHPRLLRDLSRSVGAFYAQLQAMSLTNNVTTFTSSEFGRTTSGNGNGTDHGWGNHHFVIGGAVDGGKVFGRMPDLSSDDANPDNAGWGQIIPTLSVDQYAATLARWFGLTDNQLNAIFVNLGQMNGAKLSISGANLGFMR